MFLAGSENKSKDYKNMKKQQKPDAERHEKTERETCEQKGRLSNVGEQKRNADKSNVRNQPIPGTGKITAHK